METMRCSVVDINSLWSGFWTNCLSQGRIAGPLNLLFLNVRYACCSCSIFADRQVVLLKIWCSNMAKKCILFKSLPIYDGSLSWNWVPTTQEINWILYEFTYILLNYLKIYQLNEYFRFTPEFPCSSSARLRNLGWLYYLRERERQREREGSIFHQSLKMWRVKCNSDPWW